jgi:Fe-S-cluster containining protein
MSSAARVTRPVVRSFTKPHVARAIAWARAGGHAIWWETPSRPLLVFRRPDRADIGDLGKWSLLDLELDRWTEPKAGPFRGLAFRRLPADVHDIVKNRAKRDAVHPGPTRTLRLDCLACGACCRDNEVILEDEDFTRLERAELAHLARAPWARRDRDGRVVLRLAKDERCKHLARDNKCGIYEARPNACREFPMGSECCLWARYEELDIADGDRWE